MGTSMGQLKPGATYIYERSEGIVYARESGADPGTRQVVGYEKGTDYDPVSGHKIDHNRLMEDKLWGNIRRAAETNPTLQDAMDRVIMIYQLSKTDE
jgi:hypothetical protein